MIRISILPLLFVMCFSLMQGTQALADATIVSKSKSYDSPGTQGSSEMKMKIRLGDKGIRTDNIPEQKNAPPISMIYRNDSGDEFMLILNHREKEYQKITEEDIKEMKKSAEETREKMEEAMKNMPPAMREMARQRMEHKAPPEPEKVQLKKVDSGVKVGKWTCDKYEAYRDGDKVSELWVTDIGALSEEDYDMLSRMSDFGEKVAETTKSLRPGSESGAVDQQRFFDQENFPVKSINYSKGRKVNESMLKKIDKGDVPDSIFEAPEGYERQENPQFGGK